MKPADNVSCINAFSSNNIMVEIAGEPEREFPDS